MSRDLALRLVLPLILLAGASLALHSRLEAGGFFINFSTELIGIVITVAYVDWILTEHEKKLWKGSAYRVRQRLIVYVNSLVSGIRHSLGFPASIVGRPPHIDQIDLTEVHKRVVQVGVEIIAPATRERLENLSPEEWKDLGFYFQSSLEKTDKVLVAFGQMLRPREYEILLDIQEQLNWASIFWNTFPDLAGASLEDLRVTTTPPEILVGYNNTAEGLRRVLELARTLSMELQAE